MHQSIYLLGFMGCGKSYWGKWGAAQLGCPFLDLDNAIELAAQASIAQIFEKAGEAGFRALERQQLQATAGQPPAIVATGGGAPCFFDNMAWMNAHGHTLFIDVPPSVLAARLAPERAHRPLLRELDDAALEIFIAERLALRRPFYEQAQQTVSYCEDPEKYARQMLEAFQQGML